MNQEPNLFEAQDRPTGQNTAFADVLLPVPFGDVFEYRYNPEIPLYPGAIVQIPFGKRLLYGVISALKKTSTTPLSKIKDIKSMIDWAALTPQDLAFLHWMSGYTMIPKGLVLKMFLSTPTAFEAEKPSYAYMLATDVSGKLTGKQKQIVTYLETHPGAHDKTTLQTEAGVSSTVIAGALKKGILTRVPQSIKLQQPDPTFLTLSYSPEQQQAIATLQSSVAQNCYETLLIDGITGSGKTEVYFEAIAQNLKEGRQSVVLLPEISLTPQWLERFEKRFGAPPIRWHSQMTPAQRRKAWRYVAKGQASVVVGARSALMLPYPNLGLIIVDEEHETSYKQEESAIYHARDMAVAKAYHGNIPIILVSATPSLESYINVQEGKYTLLELPNRHGGAQLPTLDLVDMRHHDKRPAGQPEFLSTTLKASLLKALENKEQALLFLNRRGYAPLTLCRSCGERLECPHCTAWLVQHKSRDRLQCHHCGFGMTKPKTCSKCEEEDSFIACGPGVERIAEEVHSLAPDARILIMASDAFDTTEDLVQAIERIQNGEIDVIIGTQMMAKGHHFPKLTLVGVIDADLGLSGGDLRACEKTFQLLQQVAGRCGRSEKRGHVFIQTYYPDHPVLKALVLNDKNAFMAQEKEMRQSAGMPPYSRLAALIISGPDPQAIEQWVRALGRQAPSIDGVEILGPAQAPLAVLRRQYRWRFLVKAPKTYPIQKYIQSWLSQIKCPPPLKLHIDIDPISFM